jgi:phage-related protein
LTSTQIDIERVSGVPGSVWELRRKFEGVKYRIYFCVDRGEVWLLHNLEKKSPKIPMRDLDLIRRRAKEVLAR